MKVAITIPLLLALVLLQRSFLPLLFPLGTCPNLLLVLCLGLRFLGDDRKSLWAAFLGGLFLDLLELNGFGLSSLSLVAISIGIGFVLRFTGRSFWVSIPLTFLVSVLYRISVSLANIYWRPLFLEAALTSGFMAVFLPFLMWFRKRFWGTEDLQLGFRI